MMISAKQGLCSCNVADEVSFLLFLKALVTVATDVDPSHYRVSLLYAKVLVILTVLIRDFETEPAIPTWKVSVTKIWRLPYWTLPFWLSPGSQDLFNSKVCCGVMILICLLLCTSGGEFSLEHESGRLF